MSCFWGCGWFSSIDCVVDWTRPDPDRFPPAAGGCENTQGPKNTYASCAHVRRAQCGLVHAHALILQWDSHSLDTLHHGVRIQIVRVGGYSSSCATRRAQCSCGLVETFRLVRAPRCRRRRRGPTGANKLRAETTRPPWKAKRIEIEIEIEIPISHNPILISASRVTFAVVVSCSSY